MSEEKDIISNLRAIIISSKGGLLLHNIQNDYIEAFGTKVPLKKLGCNSLREFLEKNSSEFQLVGDKVEVIIKSNSAHIASLVKRQKGKRKVLKTIKNFKSPRRQRDSAFHNQCESANFANRKQHAKHDIQPRPIKDNNEKCVITDCKNSPKNVGKVHFEEITLRRPHDVKYVGQNQNMQRVEPVKDETALENDAKPKPIIKTIKNDKYSDPSDTVNNQTVEYLETFNDVEDLPMGKGAQSRLLRQKYKNLQKLKSMEVAEKSEGKAMDGSQLYFDLDSIASPSPISQPIPENNPNVVLPKITGSNASCNIPKTLTHQRAQARIANIKSSIQATLLQEENNRNVNISSNSATVRHDVNSLNNGLAVKDNNNEPSFNCKMTNLVDNINKNLKLSVNRSQGIVKTGENTVQGELSETVKMSRNTMLTDMTGQAHSKFIGSSVSEEYVNKLSELCRSRSLPEPSYKIIVREPKDEPKHYICKVSIEDYLQFSSYPIETQDPFSAKAIAAKKMYNYVMSDVIYESSTYASEKEVVPRVMEIVSPTYGVWSDKLPLLYRETYKEDIPKDWLKVIMKTSAFEIDDFDGNRFIIRKKAEMYPGSPLSVSSVKALQLTPLEEAPQLMELQLPETEYWDVYVTNIKNSNEIWCRLIGETYSDAYDTMMTKLELEPPERKVTKPRVGGIYGIKVSAIWYRVTLVEIKKDHQGLVFYIDVGDKDVVDLNELYEPDETYFSVAPQAITLSLYELGSFADDEELTSDIISNLLGNTYIAEIIKITPEMQNTEQDRKAVRLWDTSNERDINVNELLLNKIIKNIKLPSLPSLGQLKEVVVSSVNDNGTIHIQTCKKSVHHLKCLIFNKIKSLEGKSILRNANDTIGMDIIYLAKCKKSDIFCRIKVVEIHNANTVDISFIDYGYTERILVSDLIHLEKSSILQAIPAQSIKVKLANVANFTPTLASKLREIVLNQDVLMKVISSDRGSLASVEFLKRSTSGNILYSVNMKITSDPDVKTLETTPRRKSVVMGLEKVLPKNLMPPQLPGIGEHFEVFVASASSPDLFIIHPLASRSQLMELMYDLQNTFAGQTSQTRSTDFAIGELYAVQHPDGNWYRGCAQAVVGSYSYSVYLCDFGDCIMVTGDKIMPLPARFTALPYQAVRATLFGIQPEHRDWTPVDCINFHKLVVEKYFFGTVMEVNRDEKNPNYVSLGIILTDTSGPEDVYIHKVLLEKKKESSSFIKSSNNI